MIFQSNGYGVIIVDYDVTNKVLSLDSDYTVDVVMWPKFGDSSISIRIYDNLITSISQGFHQKNHFFWGMVLVQVQKFGIGTRYDLEILHQCGKRANLFGAKSYVCRSYREKTGRGAFFRLLAKFQ